MCHYNRGVLISEGVHCVQALTEFEAVKMCSSERGLTYLFLPFLPLSTNPLQDTAVEDESPSDAVERDRVRHNDGGFDRHTVTAASLESVLRCWDCMAWVQSWIPCQPN